MSLKRLQIDSEQRILCLMVSLLLDNMISNSIPRFKKNLIESTKWSKTDPKVLWRKAQKSIELNLKMSSVMNEVNQHDVKTLIFDQVQLSQHNILSKWKSNKSKKSESNNKSFFKLNCLRNGQRKSQNPLYRKKQKWLKIQQSWNRCSTILFHPRKH